MKLRVLLCLLLLALVTPASAAGRSREITWHGNQIRMYDAQGPGRLGSGVLVAVLDGWVDRQHPDFEGRARIGADCTTGSCVSGQTRDACTHGTHVAGTIASSSFGVAPRASILPVRVLKDDGKGDCTGTPGNVVAGIKWATAQGARVLNLSLGAISSVTQSSAISDAVAEAAAGGAVIIFSAGNASGESVDAYGGNALVVAATGPSGALADYSQRGAGVDVAAPGGQARGTTCSQSTCVTSLYPDGQYAVAAGTSMAAPHVAGIAALLLAQDPSRSRSSVLSRITSTARPLSGAGSGLVDARAALGAKAATPRPTTTQTRAPVVVAPKPKPAASKPTVVKASPTTAPVVKPSPTKPVPTIAPSPEPEVDPPPLALPDLAKPEDEIPVPLALTAAGLIALGVLGVAAASRPRA